MRGKTNSVTSSGGGTSKNTLKNLLDATKSAYCLFYNYTGSSVDNLISYDDTENVTNMNNMFNGCSNIINSPSLNSKKVTGMNNTFQGCSKLKIVGELDVISCTTSSSFSFTFYQCSSLEEIHFKNIRVNLDISSSTNFTSESLQEIIINLYNVSPRTNKLTMGSTNLAKVSEEYVTIATNKGWTLV